MYDFADANHANGYLIGTIVRLNNNPVYIDMVESRPGEGLVCISRKLGGGRGRATLIKEFDLSPVPLGMMNLIIDKHIREAIYLTRAPERRWKIGLTLNGLNKYPIRHDITNPFWNLGQEEWFMGESLRDCIKGVYPDYQQCLDILVHSRKRSVAFSRRFAIIGEDSQLMYRAHGAPVGVAEIGQPILFDGFEWLREQLMEDYNEN